MQYNGLQHYIFDVFYNCFSISCWEDISYTPLSPNISTYIHEPSAAIIVSHPDLRVAVTPSLWPWIDVFAIPKKCNMAVTESGLDPMVREMLITFY